MHICSLGHANESGVVDSVTRSVCHGSDNADCAGKLERKFDVVVIV